MKKYTKPMIVFESFTLSTNIAGDCEIFNNNNPSKGTCAYIVKFGKGETHFFTSSIGACIAQEQDDGSFVINGNTFCYHVPDESYTLFNS